MHQRRGSWTRSKRRMTSRWRVLTRHPRMHWKTCIRHERRISDYNDRPSLRPPGGVPPRSPDRPHVHRPARDAADGVRLRPRPGHPDRREQLRRRGHRPGGIRVQDRRQHPDGHVRLRGHGPDDQPRRQDHLHVRRTGQIPHPVPDDGRRRHLRRGGTFHQPLFDVYERAGAEDHPACDPLRRKGAAENGPAGQQPGGLVRALSSWGQRRARCRKRSTSSRSERPT